MKMLSAVLVLALAAGCGLRGDLERAPPLWGEQAKAEYEREKAEKEKKKDAPAADPSAEQKSTP